MNNDLKKNQMNNNLITKNAMKKNMNRNNLNKIKQKVFEKVCKFCKILINIVKTVNKKCVKPATRYYKEVYLPSKANSRVIIGFAIYKNFSTKVLISGTVFVTIYIIVYFIFLIIIIIDIFSEKKLVECSSLSECTEFLLRRKIVPKHENDLLVKVIDKTDETKLNLNFVNYQFLTLNNYHREAKSANLLFIYANLLHILISFYSLSYDYLLKKLTFRNMAILFIISSTVINILIKDYSLFGFYDLFFGF